MFLARTVFYHVGAKFVLFFQGKLFSDSESIQARAEAAMLLKQLDFPVCIALLNLSFVLCSLRYNLVEEDTFPSNQAFNKFLVVWFESH
uniref:Vacuolar protein sorting-associated protein 51 homolog isoform X4 n=1 Tax=Rhizophora mucronata TaxID=61149 RepID=A0A2P2LK85_RHIMU